ncbi:MAG: DUF3142 domain-containing protein [Candidatus Obscuribacterales bacterium]|nr:DUF3142 domain-containing protein [Candidatus Obscuribacterales bacterium]
MRFSILLFLISSLLLALSAKSFEIFPSRQEEDLVLWSWESADNFDFIESKQKPPQIAAYQGTIVLGRETATLVPRKNTLHIPLGIQSFPVYRIETARPNEPSSKAAFKAAELILLKRLAKNTVSRLQIDFDAGYLDRKVYGDFLKSLKEQLPTRTKLSITALSSACLADKWMKELSADEVVCMLFSMGKGKEQILNSLTKRLPNSGGKQVQSFGISINERITNQSLKQSGVLRPGRRIYAFSSLGWTRARYSYLLKELGQK